MIKKYLFFITVGLLTLSACTHDIPEIVNLDSGETIKKPAFTVIRESDLDLGDMSLYDKFSYMETGEEVVDQTRATYSNLIGSVSGILSSVMSKKVHQVIGYYESEDLHGDKIELSGKIIYPTKGKIRNMVIVSHYTIGSNDECPSESFSFESVYAALGYAVVIPDYIGFGKTVDMIHPYLQAKTTASNVIDMAIVARDWLKEAKHAPQNDSVILVGYSQGGATTMHVQRFMETDERYEGLFKIKKNYAGSGPYNIAKTYDYSVKRDITGIPSAVPMIIQGMSIGMAKPLDMNYFFQEPLRSNYNDWLNSKKYTVLQMNTLIGSNKLSEILTPEAQDRSKSETARFYRELVANSIPTDYIPAAPIYMFHSEDDTTVPFVNSQILQRQFRDYDLDIVYDFDHYGNHQQGAMKFILKVAVLLNK